MTVRDRLFGVAAVLLLGFGTFALAGEGRAWSNAGSATVPAFVRVTEVKAIGPDGREQVIFSRASGRLVPVMSMDRIGQHVDPAKLSQPGVYRHLRAQLANELLIFGPGHRVAKTHFSSTGVGPVVDLNGQLLVSGGRVDASSVSLFSRGVEGRSLRRETRPVRHDRRHHDRYRDDDD